MKLETPFTLQVMTRFLFVPLILTFLALPRLYAQEIEPKINKKLVETEELDEPETDDDEARVRPTDPWLKDLDLFGGDATPLNAKITADFKKFRKSKFKPEYQPAQMMFYKPDGDSVSVEIKLKPRGEMRRGHCHLPPIMLNFRKGDFEASSLKDHDKVKLVTHCRNSKTYGQNLAVEYLIYKAYNLLTPYSFNVRWVNIYYLDSAGKKSPGRANAFLIEPETQLAERIDAVNLKAKIPQEGTDRGLMTLTSLFQFMIGNTDWSVPVQHNIRIIKTKDPSIPNPIAIPFDFDYCGLVNADYAVPPEELNMESVRQRRHRGFCREESELQKYYDLFMENKDDIIGLFANSDLLDNYTKSQAVGYLEEFFTIISTERLARGSIMSDCRQR